MSKRTSYHIYTPAQCKYLTIAKLPSTNPLEMGRFRKNFIGKFRKDPDWNNAPSANGLLNKAIRLQGGTKDWSAIDKYLDEYLGETVAPRVIEQTTKQINIDLHEAFKPEDIRKRLELLTEQAGGADKPIVDDSLTDQPTVPKKDRRLKYTREQNVYLLFEGLKIAKPSDRGPKSVTLHSTDLNILHREFNEKFGLNIKYSTFETKVRDLIKKHRKPVTDAQGPELISKKDGHHKYTDEQNEFLLSEGLKVVEPGARDLPVEMCFSLPTPNVDDIVWDFNERFKIHLSYNQIYGKIRCLIEKTHKDKAKPSVDPVTPPKVQKPEPKTPTDGRCIFTDEQNEFILSESLKVIDPQIIKTTRGTITLHAKVMKNVLDRLNEKFGTEFVLRSVIGKARTLIGSYRYEIHKNPEPAPKKKDPSWEVIVNLATPVSIWKGESEPSIKVVQSIKEDNSGKREFLILINDEVKWGSYIKPVVMKCELC